MGGHCGGYNPSGGCAGVDFVVVAGTRILRGIAPSGGGLARVARGRHMGLTGTAYSGGDLCLVGSTGGNIYSGGDLCLSVEGTRGFDSCGAGVTVVLTGGGFGGGATAGCLSVLVFVSVLVAADIAFGGEIAGPSLCIGPRGS
jgi:hypothetical protein